MRCMDVGLLHRSLRRQTTAPARGVRAGADVRCGQYERPVRPLPPFCLFWKSAIIFLILAWFCGLRASWTSFAATPDAMSLRIMPAMFASLLLTDSFGA